MDHDQKKYVRASTQGWKETDMLRIHIWFDLAFKASTNRFKRCQKSTSTSSQNIFLWTFAPQIIIEDIYNKAGSLSLTGREYYKIRDIHQELEIEIEKKVRIRNSRDYLARKSGGVFLVIFMAVHPSIHPSIHSVYLWWRFSFKAEKSLLSFSLHLHLIHSACPNNLF